MCDQPEQNTRLHAQLSQLKEALIRKLRGSLMCLANLLTCYLLVFGQPGTGKRPIDRCRN